MYVVKYPHLFLSKPETKDYFWYLWCIQSLEKIQHDSIHTKLHIFSYKYSTLYSISLYFIKSAKETSYTEMHKRTLKRCHALWKWENERDRKREKDFYLEDNLVVWCWGPSDPESKFTRISFNVFSNTQLRGLQPDKTFKTIRSTIKITIVEPSNFTLYSQTACSCTGTCSCHWSL